jgi:hypothetical protein
MKITVKEVTGAFIVFQNVARRTTVFVNDLGNFMFLPENTYRIIGPTGYVSNVKLKRVGYIQHAVLDTSLPLYSVESNVTLKRIT